MSFAGKQIELEITMLRRRSQAQKDKYVFSQIWNLDLRKKEQTWNRKVERWLGEGGRRTQDSEEVVSKIKVHETHYFVQLPHGNAGNEHFVRCSPMSEMFKYGKGVLCVYMHIACFTMSIDACVHVWACMWRSCINLDCHSSTTSHFEFCDRATHWPAIPVGLGCRCLKTKCTDAWFFLSEVANGQPEHFFLSCVWHYLCTHLSVHVCTCGGWMPMLGNFPSCSPYFLLRTGFSLKLELISLARLAGHCVSGIFLSQPPQC